MTFNGNPDLSQVIVGEYNACVKTFVYKAVSGIARNSEVYVYGQGPNGSGDLCLTFCTANGRHDMTLSSASPDCHSDKFSDGSAITTISWGPKVVDCPKPR